MKILAAFTRICLPAAVGALGVFSVAVAGAADWPAKPIRIVVPYAAGGGADVISRGVGEALTKRFGQPVITDNKVGANGAIGAAFVARAPADGYTILLTQLGPSVTAPLTQKDIPYDPIKDFTPIILLGKVPMVMFVSVNSGYRSVEDVAKYARANPGKLDYGSPGVGSAAHLAAELLQRVARMQLFHVPFKGSAANGPAVLGGQVSVAFDTVPSSVGLIKSGKVRPLAVTASMRSNSIADVPTMQEAGYSGVEMGTWYAYAGPAGLPRPVVDAFNSTANIYVKSSEGGIRLDNLGLLADRGGSPEDFAAFLKSEVAKLEPIVRAANITMD